MHPESRELLPILSSAQAIRIDGAQFYGIMYGGMDWWTCISSHRVPKFEELSIRTDGTMLVGAVSMAEIGSIQEVSRKYSRYRK